MKKIPTIFVRDPNDMGKILDEPHPDCGWVFSGEGVATRKYDGTCCMIQDGKYYKRREAKKGKPEPADFIYAGDDGLTGKRVGWMPVGDGPEDQYHREACPHPEIWDDGTFELIGPKIQGNPERTHSHVLAGHANASVFPDAPRTFNELREWLKDKDIEGLVFHHPDGRMAKIKKKDFGLTRVPESKG